MEVCLEEHRFVCSSNQPVYLLNRSKIEALQFANDNNAIEVRTELGSGTAKKPSLLPLPASWHPGVEPLLSYKIADHLYVNSSGRWVKYDYTNQN